MLLLLALACSPAPDPLPPIGELPEGFHLGVNEPWLSYGSDFGDNAWDVGGLATHADTVDADLAALAAAGVSVVRWFVFTDGRSGLRTDADGEPVGIQDAVFDDMETLVGLAEAHGLQVVPVLLDFHYFGAESVVDGVTMGGRAEDARDPDRRAALVDLVFRPLLSAFGDRPGVLAWDIVNEPAWAVDRTGADWLGDSVPHGDLVALLDLAIAAVHDETDQRATVGAASVFWWLLYWPDLDVDLVQVHSYDDAAWHTTGPELGAGRPCVIGELGTAAGTDAAVAQAAELEARGYDGVWLWSLRGEDDQSDLDLEGLAPAEG